MKSKPANIIQDIHLARFDTVPLMSFMDLISDDIRRLFNIVNDTTGLIGTSTEALRDNLSERIRVSENDDDDATLGDASTAAAKDEAELQRSVSELDRATSPAGTGRADVVAASVRTAPEKNLSRPSPAICRWAAKFEMDSAPSGLLTAGVVDTLCSLVLPGVDGSVPPRCLEEAPGIVES